MKVVIVQSRPYQAFAGGDGAYTSGLVRHLDDLGCEVIGITSGSTKGRPRPFLRLAYPRPRSGAWYFRSTTRLNDTYIAIGWQLVRDTIAFLRKRQENPDDAVSAFAIAPDHREQVWIDRVLRRERPDMVILTFEATGAVNLVKRLGIPLLALVGFLPIRSHALSGESVAHDRSAGSAEFLDCIQRADRVGFSSRDDCNFARTVLNIDEPIYVGMGFARQSVRTAGDSRTLLFVGNKTEPNREAVTWFVDHVWPQIRAAVPDARFRIVGRVGHYFASDPAASIDCVGEVFDLSEEYVRARAVVAPLTTGSAGVKTKVAEAISYGCPLVVTSLGVDAGDVGQIDRAGFVADTGPLFAAHAITLLTDDAIWREKHDGTTIVFNHLFSREAAYGELDALIDSHRPDSPRRGSPAQTGTTPLPDGRIVPSGRDGGHATLPAVAEPGLTELDRRNQKAGRLTGRIGPELPLIFNGKFYSGQLNGVHRVADRLIRQIDRILSSLPEEERPRARIYVPADRTWSPQVTTIEVIEDPRADSQRWEQLTLPRLAAGGVLINLCNLAPLLHSRKILLIHDAQFLFSDSSYPTQQRLGYKYLIPLMARRAQRVLTVSGYSKRILDVCRVSRADRTAVLYNGVDHMLDEAANPVLLEELSLERENFVVVFGSAKAYKNVEIVFKAFTDARLADRTLVVVGDSEASLRAAGLTPPEQARFVGPVSDGQLRALYENALCLAFPSKTEGFGLPPLEGMLLGCPAVVAPAGAIPEVCHDAALYASADDATEWVEAILAIGNDKPLRAAKIAAGRRRAAHFTWEQAGQRLLDVARDLAANGR